jgi:hypothetical protein
MPSNQTFGGKTLGHLAFTSCSSAVDFYTLPVISSPTLHYYQSDLVDPTTTLFPPSPNPQTTYAGLEIQLDCLPQAPITRGMHNYRGGKVRMLDTCHRMIYSGDNKQSKAQ